MGRGQLRVGRAIVCEDATQVAKIVAVRDSLPALRTIVVDRSGRRRRRRHRARRAARARPRAATPPSSTRAIARRRPRRPLHVHLHLGHDGAAEGLRAHARQLPRGRRRCVESANAVQRRRGHLPLPAARPRLRAADPARALSTSGTTIAYFGGDTQQIVPELHGGQADLPARRCRGSSRRSTRWLSVQPPRPAKIAGARRRLGVQGARHAGPRRGRSRAELQAAFDAGRRAAVQERARVFGGNLAPGRHRRRADRAGDPRVLLRLRRARARGLRHDRDRDRRHHLDRRGPPLRHGRPRAARRRGADRRRRRAPAARAPTSSTATTRTPTRASARSSTAGCTRATSASIDEDGYLSITGRKKDIIITAGGKNLTPANLENDLKQSRWISQAVMHGDRRPYPVVLITLDEEEIVPWASEHGHRGHLDRRPGARARGPRADPGRARRGQRQVRPGRADQEVLHPRPRPLAGDRRADADAEGQAQRRQRQVRRQFDALYGGGTG